MRNLRFGSPAMLLVALWVCVLFFAPNGVEADASDDTIEEALSSDRPFWRDIANVSLKEVPSAPAKVAPTTPLKLSPLTRLETKQIFSSLVLPKALILSDEVAKIKTLDSQPAPTGNAEIQALSLSGDANGEASSHSFKVAAYTPVGETREISRMTIGFSEPMIPMDFVKSPSAEDVPVKIEPPIAGKWRWLDSKTLSFQSTAKHFPMATEFKVSVAKGTRSLSGQALNQTVEWTFSTPRIEFAYLIKNDYTNYQDDYSEMIRFGGLMGAGFGQKINPEVVLRYSKLTGPDNQEIGIRLATDVEITAAFQKDPVHKPEAGRAVFFMPLQPLKPDVYYTLTFRTGLPSADGPLLSKEPIDLSISFKDPHFGFLDNQLHKIYPAGEPWFFALTHEPNLSKAKKSMIRVEPPLTKMQIQSFERAIMIMGEQIPNQKYKVFVDGSLSDYKGQTLGKTVALEVNTKAATPNIFWSGQKLEVLKQTTPKVYDIYSINHDKLKLKLWRAQAKDWKADYTSVTPPLRTPDYECVLEPELAPNVVTATHFNLEPYLKDGLGHLIINVSAVSPSTPRNKMKGFLNEYTIWLESTNLALRADTANDAISCWVTSMRDNTPASGVEISLSPEGVSTRTDREGFAAIRPKQELTNETILVAKQGNDFALLEAFLFRNLRSKSALATLYGFTDRKLYRPSEVVNVKGWLRVKANGSDKPSVLSVLPPGKKLSYACSDWNKSKLAEGECTLNEFGGFDFAIRLPEHTNHGSKSITVIWEGEERNLLDFDVKEFKRPEYELSINSDGKNKYLDGDTTIFAAKAKYFTGKPLSAQDLFWSVSAKAARFSPPGWPGFQFQDSNVWQSGNFGTERHLTSSHLSAKTDSDGTSSMQCRVEKINTHQPVLLTAQAEVRTKDSNSWKDFAQVLYHPADLYVGLKYEKTIPGTSESDSPRAVVSAIVVNIDGVPVSGKTVDIATRQGDYYGQTNEVNISNLSVRSEQKPVSIEIPLNEQWNFLTATVQDTSSRQNKASLVINNIDRRFSFGESFEGPTLPKVELSFDKSEYLPGEQAALRIKSPFKEATGLLQIIGDRSVERRIIRLNQKNQNEPITIPVLDAYGRGRHLSVTLYSTNNNQEEAQIGSGKIDLKISTERKELKVIVSTDKSLLGPGQNCRAQIEVFDYAGNPVPNTEVALEAVDEAVLALNDYKPADPMSTFYPELGFYYAHSDDLREHFAPSAKWILELYKNLLRSPELSHNGDYESFGPFSKGERNQPRHSFTPLAVFKPSLVTNEAGKVSVNFKVPDSLTRYKIKVVAANKKNEFGMGQASFTVDKDIAIRLNQPRFIRLKDNFFLPVTLQNNSDKNLEVEIAARATNGQMNTQGFKSSLKPKSMGTLYFKGETSSPGSMGIQVAAQIKSKQVDAIEISLPVKDTKNKQSFAVYDSLDQNAALVKHAIGSSSNFERPTIDITASANANLDLDSALEYLKNYRFDCSEQISSRLLSMVAMSAVGDAQQRKEFALKNQETMKNDIRILVNRQNNRGLIRLWDKDGLSPNAEPFVTLHAIHALIRAKDAGLAVPEQAIKNAKSYFTELKLDDDDKRFARYESLPPITKLTLAGYAGYVQNLLGEPNDKFTNQILKKGLENVPLESVAWILPSLKKKDASLAAKAIQTLNNAAKETASTVNFQDSSSDPLNLLCTSDIRQDAIILDALINTDPTNRLVPKLLRTLLLERRNGNWINTNDSAFSIVSLCEYRKAFEKLDANFDLAIWLGNQHVGQTHFTKGSANTVSFSSPINTSLKKANVTLKKDGSGKLYYRVGMSYLQESSHAVTTNQGFTIFRKYEGAENKGDVITDQAGVVHVKRGSLVRVNIKLVTADKDYSVALVDPLPAGLEPANSEFSFSKMDPWSVRYLGFVDDRAWNECWYDHDNLRDDRAEAFVYELEPGEYTYKYTARAMTRGTFLAPPARVEEMYAPETFGHTAATTVIVE